MSKGSRQSLVELESLDEPIEEEEFPLGLGCALELFREKDEVVDILKSLPEVYTDTKAVRVSTNKILILDIYVCIWYSWEVRLN